jgi:hypothetical protein
LLLLSQSLLLVLSSLHSLSSLLLLLLLLRAVLVLAPADGAAWVRAALVRDLVLRTSCPSYSSVSCWDALCWDSPNSWDALGVSFITGSDQKRHLNQSASNPQD